MSKTWDVLGVGCTTVDELLYVAAYPLADVKVAVNHRERQCGGLAATALVAAARQGASCAYAGALGDDQDSAYVRAALAADGIDVSLSPRHPAAGPIRSTIVVDQTAHTRNIFFHRPQIVGPLADSPGNDQVRATRVLLVDHYGGPATVRVQRLAQDAGVPIVADLERDDLPEFDELLRRCDHLIISERFACRLSGCTAPAAAAASLRSDREVVIVTSGPAGCWFISRGESRAQRQAAFPAKVVDTTGCGDTFHGVYAAELARGTPLSERVRRSSAAAAIKAGHYGAQKGIPTRAAVGEFLRLNNV